MLLYYVEPLCNETEIRLVNDDGHVWELGLAGQDSNLTIEGRVEICVNGMWSTVCDNGWDVSDAEVVCRQLNLTSECEIIIITIYTIYNLSRQPESHVYTDAMALSEYGGGSGPIYYRGVRCTGNEARLVDCIAFNSLFCFHYEDAGVRCPSGEI